MCELNAHMIRHETQTGSNMLFVLCCLSILYSIHSHTLLACIFSSYVIQFSSTPLFLSPSLLLCPCAARGWHCVCVCVNSPRSPCFLARVSAWCVQIPALGIRADAITFANCTMESEKFITVREQAGDAVMIHMVFLISTHHCLSFVLCV
jgi:hypothetical protein